MTSVAQPSSMSNDGFDSFERRCRVTLVFADLSDYTSFSEASDPEDVADVRRGLMQLASEVVAKHQGQINQFVGDGIVAVFGLPQAHEDDGRRAIDAAVELQERVRALEWNGSPGSEFRLRLHIGVHSGTVFAKKGDPLHGQYQLTGDAVNTASRLCGAAARDEVIVSDAALLGLEAYFEAEPVEPLRLKGKKDPVLAWRILGSLAVESRFHARSRRGLTPFVGRQKELRVLETALSDCCKSRGGVLCVLGDAGVGKTRLLDEFGLRATRAGISVHRGSCESYGGVTPLRPFLQIVRELLPIPDEAPLEQRILRLERGLEGVDEGLRVHLPAFLQLLSISTWEEAPSGTEELQMAVISAVTELLLAAVAKQPRVLMFDDWQWSDGASIQVLGRLMRAARDRPLLLVVGARSLAPDDQLLAQAPAFTVGPFTEAESIHAARILVASDVASDTLRGVHVRSGGNPLFLEELCSSVKLGIQRLDDAPQGAIPTTVHALIRARAEALEPDLLELLGAASVIGNELPIALLLKVAASPNAAERLDALVQTGLLQPTEAPATLRFKHGLTREVVYDAVRIFDRRELHRKVAETLESQYQNTGLADQYEVLASHFARANEHRAASRYAELAGDKAAATSALDGARHHYAAALAQIDELSSDEASRKRWLSIVVKWSAACVYYPSREQLDVLGRAARYAQQLHDYQALALVEHWTGWIHYALGAQEPAIEHLKRALVLSERDHRTRLTAQLLLNIGQSYAAIGEYEPALEYLDRGIEIQRRWPALGKGGAYALGCRALVHADRGEFGVAYVQAQEGLSLVRDTGNALEGSLYGLLGMIQLWQGAWQDALQTAARGRATGERFNGPYVLAMCEAIASYARWRLDRSLLALDALTRAVEWLERRDINLYLSFCLGHLARAELEAGRVQQAFAHALRAVERAERGDALGQAMGHRVLAIVAAQNGNEAEAREHCQKALRSSEYRASLREIALTELTLGELEQRWQRADAARALLEAARDRFMALHMPWHVAESERLLHAR